MARLRPGGGTNTEIAGSGAGGAVPPLDAPREVSQPLTSRAGRMARPQPGHPAYETFQEMAAVVPEGERELAPLTYPAEQQVVDGQPAVVPTAPPAKLDPFYERLAAEAAAGTATAPASTEPTTRPGGRIMRATRPAAAPRPAVPIDSAADAGDVVSGRSSVLAGGGTVPGGNDSAGTASALVDAARAAHQERSADAVLNTMPAASDSDSPTRGIPRDTSQTHGVTSRGSKEIVGGFGDPAALQYFALDGSELGVLVIDMLGELASRIQNDLRFNAAQVYPRVAVRCVVEVTGFNHDNDFVVDKFIPDALRAVGAINNDPSIKSADLAIARKVADEVCFVLVCAKEETDANGDTVDAPDAIRVQLGLNRPRKQWIVSPSGQRQLVDVKT